MLGPSAHCALLSTSVTIFTLPRVGSRWAQTACRGRDAQNPGTWLLVRSKVSTIAPSICASVVQNLLHVKHSAPKILKQLLDLGKICASLRWGHITCSAFPITSQIINDHGAFTLLGTAVAQWLRRCVTNRKVAGSIPDGVIGIFH